MQATLTCPIAEQLEKDGFALIPDLLEREQLRGIQRAFAARLKRLRWNDVDGYEKNERYRHMLTDLLTLDQGIMDVALDPRVTEAARAYIGPDVELCEAKGWKSMPTNYDFHGWHGDMWYDKAKVDYIPRELKLGIYLSDVKSGAFKYVKGTQGKNHPRNLNRGEADHYDTRDIVEVLGPAGSAFIFDTTGIHRQSIPILEERQAFFLTYHDPNVPLQADDVDYYRYHPLLLNAAFLGNLSDDDQKMLGFGNKTNYCPYHERQTGHTGFHRLMSSAYSTKVVAGEFRRRIFNKVGRLLGMGR